MIKLLAPYRDFFDLSTQQLVESYHQALELASGASTACATMMSLLGFRDYVFYDVFSGKDCTLGAVLTDFPDTHVLEQFRDHIVRLAESGKGTDCIMIARLYGGALLVVTNAQTRTPPKATWFHSMSTGDVNYRYVTVFRMTQIAAFLNPQQLRSC